MLVELKSSHVLLIVKTRLEKSILQPCRPRFEANAVAGCRWMLTLLGSERSLNQIYVCVFLLWIKDWIWVEQRVDLIISPSCSSRASQTKLAFEGCNHIAKISFPQVDFETLQQ